MLLPKSESVSVAPAPAKPSLEYGELLDKTLSDVEGKKVLVLKASIDHSATNKMTIQKNYFNVEDYLQHNDEDIDELQYWAVIGDQKIISFTLDKDTINAIKDGNLPGNLIGDYAQDLWILPSLQ